jgi:hypothetical protein
MAESTKEFQENPCGEGNPDPDGFSRRVRRFATDARRILTHPEGSIDEVIELHRRVWHLLRETRRAESSGIHRWLLAVRRTIGDRLQTWATEDLGSLVA